MTIKIMNSNSPISEGRLLQFERDYGINLPEHYRDFIKEHNGGYPIPDCFSFGDNDDGSLVDKFLGIDCGEHSNLEKYWVTYSSRIPKHFFPIAHDPGGNLVCIGVLEPYIGRIYFWDHEFETDGSEPDMTNMHLISETLESFLDNLYDEDDA